MTKLSYAVWSFNANIKTTDLTRGAVCAQICFTYNKYGRSNDRQ